MLEGKNEAYLVVEESGKYVRYDLDPETAKYSITWNGNTDMVRVWDAKDTHVTTLKWLVHLCVPNARP
jgi:hypothetical protein